VIEFGFFHAVVPRTRICCVGRSESMGVASDVRRKTVHLEELLEDTQRQEEGVQTQQGGTEVNNEEIRRAVAGASRSLRRGARASRAELEQTTRSSKSRAQLLETRRGLATSQAVRPRGQPSSKGANQYKASYWPT